MTKDDRNLRFDINWKVTALSVLLLPALVKLGFWQLSRAEEKSALMVQWNQQQAQPAIELLSSKQHIVDNHRVGVSGQFLTQYYWLLDGKVLNSKIGYHVVMAFSIDGTDEQVLVDRGWVRADQYREVLPSIDTPTGNVYISGSWSKPSNIALVEEVGSVEGLAWPIKILEMNTEIMALQADAAFPENIIRLDEGSVGALEANWQPINTSPAKHQGYAVQWFTMSFALFILWILSNTNLKSYIQLKRIPKN